MKVLALLLLLANAFASVWVARESFVPPSTGGASPVRLPPAGVDRLRQVSEAELLRRIQWSRQAGTAPDRRQCYQLTAAQQSAAWSRFGDRLRRAGGSVVGSTSQPVEAVLGHWVFLPPQGSASAAAQAVARLRAAGIEDFYRVRDGEDQHAVSLGLYANPSNAERRQANLREMGFDAQRRIRSEQRPGTRYIVSLPANTALPDVENLDYALVSCPN
jgi:hypothetical protein